jgi:hypothetical protein
MSSIFGFVVGLLQASLALLGFVQAHPELPQASKDQAQQVAQQAITQATQALSRSPNLQALSCAAAWGTIYKIFPDGSTDSGPCICTPINPTDCHTTSDVCAKNWPPVCRDGKWIFNDGTITPSPVPLDPRCTSDTPLNTQCGGLYHCALQIFNGPNITNADMTPHTMMWPALDKADASWSFTPCA